MRLTYIILSIDLPAFHDKVFMEMGLWRVFEVIESLIHLEYRQFLKIENFKRTQQNIIHITFIQCFFAAAGEGGRSSHIKFNLRDVQIVHPYGML